MRRFKFLAQTQRYLSAHGSVNNLFRLGRHFPLVRFVGKLEYNYAGLLTSAARFAPNLTRAV